MEKPVEKKYPKKSEGMLIPYSDFESFQKDFKEYTYCNELVEIAKLFLEESGFDRHNCFHNNPYLFFYKLAQTINFYSINCHGFSPASKVEYLSFNEILNVINYSRFKKIDVDKEGIAIVTDTSFRNYSMHLIGSLIEIVELNKKLSLVFYPFSFLELDPGIDVIVDTCRKHNGWEENTIFCVRHFSCNTIIYKTLLKTNKEITGINYVSFMAHPNFFRVVGKPVIYSNPFDHFWDLPLICSNGSAPSRLNLAEEGFEDSEGTIFIT